MSVITLSHAYKAFGPRAKGAPDRLRAGESRADLAADGITAAVIDANLAVERGEIFVVMGLSGSGKSTLIRMVNGLLPATSGSVVVNDVEVSGISGARLRELRRDSVSMVFQHFALFPHRTVLENAAYGLATRGMNRSDRADKARTALELCGLAGWEDRYPKQLSGGMQQRVGLARALAAETDILLMDEAFSALDPLIRREMQDQLVDLQHRLGKTILFITHDLNEAMRLGDRIAMMRDGRIEQVGTTEEILTDPANDYVARFVADVDRSRVILAGSVMEPPVAVLGADMGPRAAHRIMREHQIGILYVLNRDRTLLGQVEEADVAAAVERGENHVTGILRQSVTVRSDAPLADVTAFSARALLPVAVVDAENHLVGVVPKVTLLNALSPDPAPQELQTPPESATGTIAAPGLPRSNGGASAVNFSEGAEDAG
ncbi:quaternary amine ABC transporter ATP-binding protein [Gephyromycinifex aptenodytis]|uniref:quaternary amine ABC transporter ATP-binding protein n=1 Tax=Gephyromycinifex aptenodytis TaxID=2716227 RepID=UPI001D017FA6|nr:glycine betaine/L-proline ABC transporter ATP-binding protein [Gephyromycinifex aptenodytis]